MNKYNLFLFGCSSVGAALAMGPGARAQTAPSFLQWFEPDPDRALSSPLYLPLAGQVFGETTYTYDNPAGDDYNGAHAFKASSFSRRDNLFSQSLAYGATDDFELRISGSYGWQDNKITSAFNGDVTTYKFSGFDNPAFGATERLIDQRDGYPVDLEFSATYSPQVVTAELAAVGHEGSVAAAHDETTLAMVVGREMRYFIVAGQFTASYLGDGQTQSPFGGAVKESSSWNYNFQINTLTRLTDAWSINAGVEYAVTGDVQSLSQFGTRYRTVTDGNWDLSAAVNYQIIPTRLVASLIYQHGFLGNVSRFYDNPGTDSRIENYGSDLFGARLIYVFR